MRIYYETSIDLAFPSYTMSVSREQAFKRHRMMCQYPFKSTFEMSHPLFQLLGQHNVNFSLSFKFSSGTRARDRARVGHGAIRRLRQYNPEDSKRLHMGWRPL